MDMRTVNEVMAAVVQNVVDQATAQAAVATAIAGAGVKMEEAAELADTKVVMEGKHFSENSINNVTSIHANRSLDDSSTSGMSHDPRS